MAPRRNSNNNGGSVSSSSSSNNNNNDNNTSGNSNSNSIYGNNKPTDETLNYSGQQQLSANPSTSVMSPMPTPANASSGTTAAIISNGGHLGHHNSNSNAKNGGVEYTRCCYPNGECCRMEALIALDDQQLSDCVRVVCNNENCNVGQYMHRDCFELWEQSVLVTLKANGRARSWSERQRVQNLWTKKGYDLVYKACGCKCGRGHLRKDLDWAAPPAGVKNGYGQQQQQRSVHGGASGAGLSGNISSTDDDDKKKSKKKRNRNNQKPTVTLAALNGNVGGGVGGAVAYQQQQQQSQQQQQQQQQLQNGNSNVNGNGNGNPLAPNPNVGVIGSGLPHNNNNNNNGNGNGNQNGTAASVNNIGGNNSNTLISNVVATLNSMIVNGGGSSGNVLGLDLRARAGSLSSSGAGSGSTSPSVSQSSADIAISPMHQQQQQHVALQQTHLQQQQQQQQQSNTSTGLLFSTAWLSKSILNGIDNTSSLKPCPVGVGGTGPLMASIANFKTLTSFDQQQLVQQQKNKEVELHSERVRSTSGCNGIFSRRLDFSSFNMLPKTRLNSYQVKIEDEGNHGNDETRLFILSSLAQSQMSRVACILCEEPLLVFDRYPLVDGSFFLSPKQHSTGCIEVKYEGRTLYLTCVCMSCLDGTSSNRVISCRFCNEPWDGSNLVLGTMYAYDLFAAMPCCAERFKCNHCFKLLMHPQQRLSFYSDYSHGVTCPYCNTQDTHFVKSLSYCYIKSNAVRPQPIA